jgi:bisphosphoglycerate-independent phosphoglycerate mutase (AlkP superfamily)
MNWWSGDHCIDPVRIPAMFLSTFRINKKIPAMQDIAPTILKFFKIDPPPHMKGKSLI